MMRRHASRLRAGMLALLASPAFALDTATIVSSVVSTDCLDYRVVGICYWLHCTSHGWEPLKTPTGDEVLKIRGEDDYNLLI
jgi:hypothetical protein